MASVVDGNGGSGLVVVTELGHLKELARQLEVHLGGSSPDLCKHLASQISSITERSISLLITTTSSPHGASDAPSIKATKKRKRMDKNRHEVRVGSAGGGGDHPADDGYSWRKYGQKEILGAKHPRGYYRCTHKRSQGCAATKQVQRTDEDPTFFDVVYLGDHTCVRSQRAAATAGQPAADAQAPEYDDANLTAKTEEQLRGLEDAPTPLRFSSTPACLVPERSPFSAPSTSENWGVSPATSDSNQAVSFPPFEVAAAAQFEFEEVMSAIDRADGDILEDLDIYVSSFLA